MEWLYHACEHTARELFGLAIKKRTNVSPDGAPPGAPPKLPEFGALLHSRRKHLSLTLQRLADMAGCAKSYLWMIENGERPAPESEELVMRLERALGLKGGELHAAARWERTPHEIAAVLRAK